MPSLRGHVHAWDAAGELIGGQPVMLHRMKIKDLRSVILDYNRTLVRLAGSFAEVRKQKIRSERPRRPLPAYSRMLGKVLSRKGFMA